MTKYIVLSVNQNVDYTYFIPLTVWSWRKIGWEPIIFYRGEQDAVFDLIFNHEWPGVSGQFGLHDSVRWLNPIEGVRDATVAQVSRLYGALAGVGMNDYLMIGDADMMALSDYWKPDYTKVTVYNHDLTGYSEIPMCYVGAPKYLWFQIMKLEDIGNGYNNAISKDFADYPNAKSQEFYTWWGCDQQVLTQRLKEYGTGKIDFINRGHGRNGFPRGRVDKGHGGWVLDQPELIDAHMLQQTHHSEEKIQKTMDLLHHNWPNENWLWFAQYTKEFKKLAK